MKEEKVPTRLFIYPLILEPVEVSDHPSLEDAIITVRLYEKEIGFYILKKIGNDN